MSDITTRAIEGRERLAERAAGIAQRPPASTPTPTPAPMYPKWSEVENNPEFATLPYQEQQVVRNNWFRAMAPRQDGWDALDAATKAYTFDRFLSAPPSILQDDLTERGGQYLQLGEQLRVVGDAPNDTSAADAVVTEGFFRLFNDQSTIYRQITNAATDLVEDIGIMRPEDATLIRGLVNPPETVADKNAYEYMLTMAARDPEISRRLHRSQGFGAVAGNITDIGVSILMASPVTAGARGTASAALMTPAAELGKVGRFLTRPIAPFIAESMTESVFMTYADRVREVYNDEITRFEGVRNNALRTTMLFGANWLGDMAMWGLFKAAMPVVRASRRVFSPRGFRTTVDQIANGTEFRDALHKVPKEVLSQMPDEVRVGMFREMQEDIAKASRMTLEDIGSPEWQRLAVKPKGYDIVDASGGGFVLRRSDVKNPSHFDDLGVYPDHTTAFNRAVDDFDLRAGINPTAADAVTGVKGRATVRRVVEGQGTLVDDVGVEDIQRLLSPGREGKLLDGNIRTAVRGLMKSSGGVLDDLGDVVIRRVDNSTWRKALQSPDGSAAGKLLRIDGKPATWKELVDVLGKKGTVRRHVEVVVPDGVLNGDDIRRLTGAFEDVAAEAGMSAASRQTLRNLSAKASTDVTSFQGVRQAVREFGGELIDPRSGKVLTDANQLTGSATVSVRAADGGIKTYPSLYEAYIGSTPHTWLNDKLLRQHLKAGFDYDLIRRENGQYFLKRRGKTLRSSNGYDSVEELLLENPDLMPKRPIETYMGDVEFDLDAEKLTFTEGHISGPHDEVQDFLQQTFKKYETPLDTTRRVVDTPAGKVDFQPQQSRYILDLEDIGFRKSFKTLEEAKTFLAKSKDDLDIMNDIALAGGSEIEYANGMFRLRLPDGSYAVSRSLEGIRPGLKNLVQDTEAYPDLLRDSGLPEGYINSLAKRYERMFSESLGDVKFNREHDFVRHVRKTTKHGQGFQTSRKVGMEMRSYETMVRLIGEDIDNPQLLEMFYKKPRVSYDVYRQKYGVVENAVRNAMRGYDTKQAKAMNEAMLFPDRNVREVFEQVGARYVDRVEETIPLMREYYDAAFETFHIDGYKFLTEYLPDIRKYFDGPHDLHTSVGDVFNQMGWKNWRQVPELKFFAENLRTRDLYEFSRDTLDGIDEALLGYFRKGLKKKYLAEPLENAREYANTLRKAGSIDNDTTIFLESFITELTGMVEDGTRHQIMEGMESSVKNFYTKVLGLKDTDPHLKRVLQNLRTWTVGAHMSWKPYLPIRNMQQVWTTLGWRIGNDAVLRAEKAFLKTPEKYVKDLLDAMVIQHGRASILEYGLETANRGLLNKFTESGMLFYRNSDDFNRAITALSAWIPYDEAVERLAKNAIGEADFLAVSRIDRLPSDIQTEVLRFTEIGDHKAAKNILARAWIDQTQFTYLRPTDPKFVKKTIVGRMFGHYSHYPRQFRENLLLGFGSQIPKATKMKSAAQLALNTLGLYMVFEKGLGINARNYRPGMASMFGGGPYYHLMNLAIQSMDTSFRGKQARAQLPEQLVRSFVPGNAFYYNFRSAEKLAANGNYVEAFARMNGAPVIDPERPTAR